MVEAQRLGSYEILGKLARGGMAELFLAKTRGPEGFEKIVVIKKILPGFAANPKFVKLFLDEARLAAGLDHPHIAHVYDMGTVDGDYFFAMEYVHGKDVRSVMRRTTANERKFPIEHAVMIARTTAAALHYAHERRRGDGTLLDIVHRDVSPSNILLSFDGAVKLVDFGVAKAATSTVKTRTGTLKGKISYMSPEQAKGAPVDRRSDVFSLGIVLWEMVTSSRLFRAENDLATIQMIVTSKPQPPTELSPECPAELERICLKALAGDPEDRYQSAEELQLDLEELARDQRLPQSSVQLRGFMQKAFAPEIMAWKEAQEQGHTLTDFVMAQQSVVGATTPVSESELEYVPEPDDEDDDPDEVPATRPLQRRLGTIEQPTPAPRSSALTPMPSVVVGRIDPSRASFPIAPKEWLPVSDPVEPPDVPVLRHWRNIKIGAVVIVAMIVLVAVVFSGGGPPSQPAAAPPADAAAVNVAPMTVTLPPDAAPPPDASERPPADAAVPPVDAPPRAVPHPRPIVPNQPRPRRRFDPSSPLPPS